MGVAWNWGRGPAESVNERVLGPKVGPKARHTQAPKGAGLPSSKGAAQGDGQAGSAD